MRKIEFTEDFGGSKKGTEAFRADNVASRLVRHRKVAKYVDEDQSPEERKLEAKLMKKAELNVRKSLSGEAIKDEVKAEMLAEDFYELRGELKAEILAERKEELIKELTGELKATMRAEFVEQMPEGVEDELRAELKAELKDDVTKDLRKELLPVVRAEIEKKLKK